MTLYQIRAFIAVAQEGGFTAAARSLGLSHSTLNSQIQALEREHGTELFLRRGRRVELSALGVELLPLARRMFALEGDMTALLADTGKQRRGSLKIAAVGPFHVTEMIEAYHAVSPHIHISVGLGNSEFVLDALDKYTSDVGVVASRFPDARYHTQLYGHYPVVAFVHADHPFARQDAIPQEALSDQRLIMRERGSTTRKALEHALLQHKVSVRIAMEIGSREALREAVARGLGIGTVSASEYVPDPRLRPVRIEGDVVSTHIHVCCLRERRDSPLISSFFDAIARRPGRQAGIAAVHASKQHGAAVPIA